MQSGHQKLAAAVSEQHRRGKIRRRTEAEVRDTGDDCADRPDEVQRMAIRRDGTSQFEPFRHIAWRVGNKREKKKRASGKQGETDDFVQRMRFVIGRGARHWMRIVTGLANLSISHGIGVRAGCSRARRRAVFFRKVCRLNAIVFFVKHPTPGRVKTRLAATVGAERAAEIYRDLVQAIWQTLPRNAEVIVMFDPPERATEIARWLAPLGERSRFIAQSRGDLGARLEDAFARAFDLRPEKVAVIGSDCMELTPAIFDEAWSALDTHDCAIGPTEDGGYYLIALRQPWPELFGGIAWSTDRVFAHTLARADEVGLRVHLLPKLHDVDTEDDWHRLERRLPS
jgi:rSAM/selenodomain-associated transferase 1